jgi:hypothetical protein
MVKSKKSAKRNPRRDNTRYTGDNVGRKNVKTMRSANVNMMTKRDPLPLAVLPQTFISSRVYEVGAILAGSSAPATGALLFTVNSVPSSADYTNLFDQYRIIQAIIAFRPVIEAPNSPGQSPGQMHTVIDYNDSNSLTSVTQAEQYDNYKLNDLTKPFTRVCYPAVSQAVYNTPTTTGYSEAKTGFDGPWINSSSQAVPYYGLKYLTDQTTITTATTVCFVTVRLIIEFKSVT